MMKMVFIILMFFSLSSAETSSNIKNGYKWIESPTMSLSLYYPDSWNLLKRPVKSKETIFFTPTVFDTTNMDYILQQHWFNVGFTITYTQEFNLFSGNTHEGYGAMILNRMKQYTTLLDEWQKVVGSVYITGFISTRKFEEVTYNYCTVYLIDAESKEMYQAIFKAPSEEWDNWWTLIEPSIESIRTKGMKN